MICRDCIVYGVLGKSEFFCIVKKFILNLLYYRL